MLPLYLLFLLQTQYVIAQLSLTLGKVSNFTAKTLPNPPVFSLPAAHSNISISVALCASSALTPRFFVSNDTEVPFPGPEDVDDGRAFEINLQDGFGAWSGVVNDGGFLAILGQIQVPIEVGVSQNGEMEIH
jgi:calcium channel MID1